MKLYLILVLACISLRANDFNLCVLIGHHFLCNDYLGLLLKDFTGICFLVNDVRVFYIFGIKALCYRYILTVLP